MTNRRISLALALTSLIGATVFVSNTALADDSAPPLGDVAEEVRIEVRPDGLIAEHHVLVDRTLTSDTAAAADQLTGITKSDEPSFTAQYRLNSWKWGPGQVPVPIAYNPANESGNLPAPLPWIQSAISQWSGITSAFSFTYSGLTSAGLGACITDGDADGINTIGYTAGMPRATLGQTCTLYTRSGRLVEFDMQINNATNWGAGNPTTRPQYDLPSTLLHELGHAAGLGHPCEPPNLSRCTASENASVMYYSIGPGVMKRTLTQDDIDGLKAQYPGGALPATPTPAPTPFVIPPYEHNFERILVGVSRD